MEPNPRFALVLDFDGTMMKGATFRQIAECAGLPEEAKADMERTKSLYLPKIAAGGASLKDEIDFLVKDVETWIRHGLTVEMAEGAMAKSEFRSGLEEALIWLRQQNVPVAVVSYGIADFIRMALKRHGLDGLIEKVYALELQADEDGRYVGYDISTAILPSNKDRASKDFSRGHPDNARRVSYDRLLAVGDTVGDRSLGHLPANRLFIPSPSGHPDRQCLSSRVDLAQYGKVIETDSFWPALRWLKEKIEQRFQ